MKDKLTKSGHWPPLGCWVDVHWLWEPYDDDKGGRWVLGEVECDTILTPEEEEVIADHFSP